VLFLTHAEINVTSLAPDVLADLQAREKEVAQRYQRDGQIRHIWRVVGRYANYCVYDVADNDELHSLLSALPLFPYMDVTVTALATHPVALQTG
jgi:muconolactone D-isomerase